MNFVTFSKAIRPGNVAQADKHGNAPLNLTAVKRNKKDLGEFCHGNPEAYQLLQSLLL